MQRIIAIVAIMALGASSVTAQSCQTCQSDNDVYCHNQTSYQNCMKSAPIGKVIECPSGTVCSNSEDVCVASSALTSTILDVCGSSGANGAQCEECSNGAKYACVSRTSYARCSSSGALLTSNVYDCDSDEICVIQALATYDTICVPSCAAEFVGVTETCSNTVYQPITTTAAPPTTPSAAQKQQACSDGGTSNTASYFYVPYTDDSTCNSYLYCQKSGTDWVAIYMSCAPTKPFFDSTTSRCVDTRPASCSVTTTTTTSATSTQTTLSSTDSTSSDSSTNASTAAASSTPAPSATDTPGDSSTGASESTGATTATPASQSPN
ncbi:serine-rich adhesin for platelets [Drosophila elegans]|uniref:serine-rich adhesin for platelets n=1 Tax=Drosophila elegans TaxID=30023 RepID=UPI0007E6CB45|nr:serine-rich adhesin for platelets [Drosophila elegans]